MQKPSIVYKYNQGDIFLANNSQVVVRNKHVNIRHHFHRYMVEDKDVYIKYIRSEENPADIMRNNCSEANHEKYSKRITEGELWELMGTRW